MLPGVEELLKKLQTGERRAKIESLTTLRRICNDKERTTEEVMQCFDDCYLHLLKCYAERFENVRDQAVQTVTAFILRLPPNDFHLLNIVSTLTERMGQQETIEESEEIRLLYVLQLQILIKEYVNTRNVQSLKQCYNNIVLVLNKSIRDAYPSVQRQACGCVVIIARAAETEDFQQYAEPLALSLYTMLNHKHAQARIAAIEALARIALHINTSGEAFKRLIVEVTPLLMDSVPLVRRECGQMGVLLLLELRDRYSFFERIIPLVLCCLIDDSPEVSAYIRPLWVQCGELYYEENELELNKQDMADDKPANYPTDAERPSIGCRALVQRSLRLLQMITRESTDWKDNVRMHALKLLYQFVLHAEAAMTAKFFEIYPDVARACRDDDPLVVAEATKVADLMGRLLNYDDWIQHGLDGLEKNARLGYLKCFYYMFTAANACTDKHLLRIAKLLQASDFSHSLCEQQQLYVLHLLDTLLDKATILMDENSETTTEQEQEEGVVDETFMEELEETIYIGAVKVTALARSLGNEESEVLLCGNLLLERIARRQKLVTDALHEKYLGLALQQLENLDAALEDNSEPILMLLGIIALVGFRASYMPQLKDKIKLVWQHCADNAKIKIFSAIATAMLGWHATIGVPIAESTKILSEFVVEIIEPHLQWAPGATADSMRSMATAAVCCIAEGAEEDANEILPTLAKYMPALLEDRSATTRHYAIKTMLAFPPLKLEELTPLAYASLQRLDDPSSGIRAIAVAVIPKLQPIFESDRGAGDADNAAVDDAWDAFIQRAIDILLLHYEGPEQSLTVIAEESLHKLTKQHPKLMKERIERALSMAYNKRILQQLSKKLFSCT